MRAIRHAAHQHQQSTPSTVEIIGGICVFNCNRNLGFRAAFQLLDSWRNVENIVTRFPTCGKTNVPTLTDSANVLTGHLVHRLDCRQAETDFYVQ